MENQIEQNADQLQNGENPNGEKQEGAEDGGQPEVKTFTQEEVNKIVEKRLNRERQRLAAAMGTQTPKELELAERERAVTEKELRLDAAETFRQEHLPAEALELLNYNDRESCEQSIELVRRVYTQNVQEAVNQRLRGGAPLRRAPENEGPDFRSAFGLSANR